MVKFPMRCFEIYDSGKFIRIRDNWKRRGKGRALSAGKRLDTNEPGMPCKLPSSLFISISGSCQPTLRTRSREIPKETTHTRPATDISEPLFRYVIGLVNVDRFMRNINVARCSFGDMNV